MKMIRIWLPSYIFSAREQLSDSCFKLQYISGCNSMSFWIVLDNGHLDGIVYFLGQLCDWQIYEVQIILD